MTQAADNSASGGTGPFVRAVIFSALSMTFAWLAVSVWEWRLWVILFVGVVVFVRSFYCLTVSRYLRMANVLLGSLFITNLVGFSVKVHFPVGERGVFEMEHGESSNFQSAALGVCFIVCVIADAVVNKKNTRKSLIKGKEINHASAQMAEASNGDIYQNCIVINIPGLEGLNDLSRKTESRRALSGEKNNYNKAVVKKDGFAIKTQQKAFALFPWELFQKWTESIISKKIQNSEDKHRDENTVDEQVDEFQLLDDYDKDLILRERIKRIQRYRDQLESDKANFELATALELLEFRLGNVPSAVAIDMYMLASEIEAENAACVNNLADKKRYIERAKFYLNKAEEYGD